MIFILKWQQNKKKFQKKVLFSLMARPLPPPPLNGPAISGGFFFAASLTDNELLKNDNDYENVIK